MKIKLLLSVSLSLIFFAKLEGMKTSHDEPSQAGTTIYESNLDVHWALSLKRTLPHAYVWLLGLPQIEAIAIPNETIPFKYVNTTSTTALTANRSVRIDSNFREAYFTIFDQRNTCPVKTIKSTCSQPSCGDTCSLSPNGKKMMAYHAKDHTIEAFDVDSGTLINSFIIIDNQDYRVADTRIDNKGLTALICKADNNISVWDIKNGLFLKEISLKNCHAGTLEQAQTNGDSKTLWSPFLVPFTFVFDLSAMQNFRKNFKNLSLRQQCFLASLCNINKRHPHHTLVLPTKTHAYQTFSSLAEQVKAALFAHSLIEIAKPLAKPVNPGLNCNIM